MKAAWSWLTCLVAFAPEMPGAVAQNIAVPVGIWQSVATDVFANPLHPVLTGGERFLKIDVAADGSFRGELGEYFCTSSLGAYGVLTATCRFIGNSEPVSGRFGPGRQGTIDVPRQGRSTFTWSTPTADELAIDLPKDRRNADSAFYRARMTRDGKRASRTPTTSDAEPLLSAVALYREFKQDERAALARHAGKRLVLEGRRGTFIELSDGGAAIHIPDGFTTRALVLTFADVKQVSGIGDGARFRFACTVESFDYQYVHLQACTIVR